MTIAERIIEICKLKENGNMSAFARNTGVTPAYISKLKNNPKAVPSGMFVRQVCAKYAVNETWIITGNGSMHDQVTDEQRIAQVVQALTVKSDVVKSAIITALSRMDEQELRKLLVMILNALTDQGVDVTEFLK